MDETGSLVSSGAGMIHVIRVFYLIVDVASFSVPFISLDIRFTFFFFVCVLLFFPLRFGSVLAWLLVVHLLFLSSLFSNLVTG